MTIKPMRGQIVVREVAPQPSSVLWTPQPGARQVHTHRGVVLAMGPPARTVGGVPVPPGFQIGDLVQFHFNHLEELLTNTWADGLPAIWVPQEDVDAVWEPDNELDRTT